MCECMPTYESKCMFLCYNELNYDKYTNIRQCFPGNLPQHLNVSEHVDMKLSQKTFLGACPFRMYEGVGGFGWCRLGSTDVKLILSLGKP